MKKNREQGIEFISNIKAVFPLFFLPLFLSLPVAIPDLPPVLFWAASRATVSNFVHPVRFSMHISRLPITAHAEKGNSQLVQCGPDPRK